MTGAPRSSAVLLSKERTNEIIYKEEMKNMKKTLTRIAAAVICIATVFAFTPGGLNVSAANKTAAGIKTESAKADRAGKDNSGKKVYFAAPLFCQSEKDYNLKLTKVLEDHGYEVFLPQRDGYLAAELEGKSEEELTEMIFEKDTSEILKADILFMNLDGRVPDEGACVELGIAYANGKRCYGFKTDVRSVEINMDLNPMITGCFTKLFKDFDGDELIKEIEEYLSENDL